MVIRKVDDLAEWRACPVLPKPRAQSKGKSKGTCSLDFPTSSINYFDPTGLEQLSPLPEQ